MMRFTRERGYCWYYVDAVVGDRLFVVIFMHAPVFSARELLRERRGRASACAVNAAVYRGGKREAWVCSESARAQVTAESITIGASSLRRVGHTLTVHVSATQSPWPRKLAFDLTLKATAPAGEDIALAPGHHWQALMPRAQASVTMGELSAEGHGYHDSNYGESPLGCDLARWRWSRVHGTEATDIYYVPEAPGRGVHLHADAQATTTSVLDDVALASERSGWGLSLPQFLPHGQDILPTGQLIESSPFYARLWHQRDGIDALTEVADFARFRSRRFAWMSYFRSRTEAA